jgi:hypothetical protein
MMYRNRISSRHPIYLAGTYCLLLFIGLSFNAEAQNTPPVFTNCEKIELYFFWPDCGPVSAQIVAAATSDCTQGNNIDYTWELDLIADGSIDLQGSGNLVKVDIPIGLSRVIFRAEDECGLFSFCERIIEVSDKAKPSIVSVNEYVMANFVTGTSTATVKAKDFILPGTKDNCTSTDNLKFLIELINNIGPSQTEPDIDAVPELILTCADFNTTNFLLREVVIWVGDEAGNWDYNVGNLVANDYYKSCTPDEFWIEVDAHNAVEIYKNALCEYSEVMAIQGMDTTVHNCADLDHLLDPTKKYIITPSNNLPFYSFSSYSLLLMSKHLNGTKPIVNPYQLIAADINNDCKISISDIIQLRKLILTPWLKLKHNTPRRFVAADFIFPDPLHPCIFDETATLNGLEPGPNRVGFIPVRIGDVSGDHLPNTLMDGLDGSDIRNEREPAIIHISNSTFEANATIKLPITLRGGFLMEGFQYGIRFDPDRLMFEGLDVHGSVLAEEDFGLSWVAEGIILVSWIGDEASMETGFSLQFKTKTAGKISEVISLSNKYLRAEAYSTDEFIHPISLVFEESTNADGIYSISPNPFQSDLKIKVQLRTEGDILLSFSDVLGHVFYQQKAQGNRGMNDIHVDGSLWPSGAIFCKIEQHGHQEVKLLFKKA